MAKDTKERILAASLEQFSQNGYAGTNIRELTASLGLVKSAMYKHFESKEDIWNLGISICSVATVAAVQEGHFIRTGRGID